MANQVKIDLSLQDTSNSVKKRTSEVQDLNKELVRSQQLASSTKTGGQAVKASYMSPKGESESYGQARGSMGATGASGRDFANQAQGLGGLVRLYATYAANLFAVSAAFSALREAMNTTMMVRGLDQLGAASGVALGGLAKQFAAASDGAISMREAMEATAKASTSGLSSKQFMELGVVAKGASQALGVNMSDAVSRLTRGITKLEPELLDELGIFTKVGKATEDYARSVGKSAAALTDFEKRQAFANAVLAEGRQKFGEIAQESNPYDKLLASLKNVAQGVLETVNTVIGPIAKILANNTELIGVAIAAAAIKITQQALPALAGWRNGMKLAAEEASKRAQEINTSFGEAFVERAQKRARVPQLQQALQQAEDEFKQAKRQFVELDNIYKTPNDTLKALQKDRLLNEKELVNIKSDVTKKTNDNTTASLKHAQSLVSIQLAQQKILDITKQLSAADDEVQDKANKRSKFLSGEWQREQIVNDARAKAAKLNLLSGVGENVEKKGLIGGLGGFYSETYASKDLGRIDKFKTAVTGTFAGIGTAAGILGRALSGAFIYLEIAVALYAGLSAIFSKNGEAVEAFKRSMDGLSEATKTGTNVAEKFGNILTTESINAKANALTNLTDGVVLFTKNFEKATADASGFDRFTDKFKVLFDSSLRQDFSKNFAGAITSAIDQVPEGDLRLSLEGKLRGVLNTQDLGLEGIEKALNRGSVAKVQQTAKNIADIIKDSNKIVKNSQVLTQDVKETGKAANEAFLSFSTSVFGTSPLQSFLLTTTKSVFSLKNAFKDSSAAAAEFKNITSGTTKLEFLPQEQAAQLQQIAENYTNMQYGLKGQVNEIDKARDRISAINKEFKDTWFMGGAASAALTAERSALQQKIPKIQLDVKETESALKLIAAEAGRVLGEAAAKQVDLVFQQTSLRLSQLNIASKQQVLAAVPVKTEASINESVKLAQQAINVEFELKKSNETLINSIDLLRIQMQLSTAEDKLRSAKAENQQTGGKVLVESAQLEVDKYTKLLNTLKTGTISEVRDFVKEEPAALQRIMNLEGTRIALQERNNKLTAERMRGDLEVLSLRSENERKGLEFEMKLADLRAEDVRVQKDISEDQRSAALATLAAAQAERKVRLDMMPSNLQAQQTQVLQDKYKLPTQVAQATQQQIATTLGQTAAVSGQEGAQSTTGANLKAAVEKQKELSRVILHTADMQAIKELESLDIQKSQVASQRELLGLANTTGSLTDLEIAATTKILAIQEAEIDRTEKLLQLDKSRTAELQALAIKRAQFGETQEIKDETAAIEARTKAAKNGAERDFQAKLKSADITEELSSRQSQYEGVFKKSFEGMTDVIVDFAKTGKLSFKDLISSMLEDLVRLELKLQNQAMWTTARGALGLGGGIAGAAAGALGKGPDLLTKLFAGVGDYFTNSKTGLNTKTMFGNESQADFVSASGGQLFAQGGAFDYGVQAFAKGGTFTNSVVDSPTLFKFAKGTGLMGEAGAEAIMPLTRDGSGNLGVRAQGGGSNVDVVVNNYGSEKATTKETVDSRGNRRIEVTVGDMVAQEVTRTGSAAQTAFSSTYGTRPALARR